MKAVVEGEKKSNKQLSPIIRQSNGIQLKPLLCVEKHRISWDFQSSSTISPNQSMDFMKKTENEYSCTSMVIATIN